MTASEDFARWRGSKRYRTILADPPWRFQNSTGKVAPQHRRLSRYETLTLGEIQSIPVESASEDIAHLYLWVPNALLPEGLATMKAWGFNYKSNIVWHKIRKDGGSDGRGVGFYFRNVTELLLFGVRGKNARTLAPGRKQVNLIATRKREHSRKPDEMYDLIEACSPGPYLELFARGKNEGWSAWGNQAEEYIPAWPTYSNHSQSPAKGQIRAKTGSASSINQTQNVLPFSTGLSESQTSKHGLYVPLSSEKPLSAGYSPGKEVLKMANQKIGRDSKTGHFIPVEDAKRRPNTTTVETIKKDNKGKK
ncbi:MAG: MT-A70 family methyltransferase [Hyphomicrobiales bacterium]|nr:MT-A70 family methyltransferase [Hyphomicrobiales bacterium]